MTKEKLHPLIENLDISDHAKLYLQEFEFYEIIEAPICLSTPSVKINESLENYWSFDIIPEHCTLKVIQEFIGAVIAAKREFISKHEVTAKLKLYFWYDEQAGHFCLSIIPVNWEQLPPGKEFPFGAEIRTVSSISEIMSVYFNDPYKGIIPFDELHEATPEEIEEEDSPNYIVDIWYIIL